MYRYQQSRFPPNLTNSVFRLAHFSRVTLAAEMPLFKPSYCFLLIYHASLPKSEIPAFHTLFSSLAHAAAAKKII